MQQVLILRETETEPCQGPILDFQQTGLLSWSSSNKEGSRGRESERNSRSRELTNKDLPKNGAADQGEKTEAGRRAKVGWSCRRNEATRGYQEDLF